MIRCEHAKQASASKQPIKAVEAGRWSQCTLLYPTGDPVMSPNDWSGQTSCARGMQNDQGFRSCLLIGLVIRVVSVILIKQLLECRNLINVHLIYLKNSISDLRTCSRCEHHFAIQLLHQVDVS